MYCTSSRSIVGHLRTFWKTTNRRTTIDTGRNRRGFDFLKTGPVFAKTLWPWTQQITRDTAGEKMFSYNGPNFEICVCFSPWTLTFFTLDFYLIIWVFFSFSVNLTFLFWRCRWKQFLHRSCVDLSVLVPHLSLTSESNKGQTHRYYGYHLFCAAFPSHWEILRWTLTQSLSLTNHNLSSKYGRFVSAGKIHSVRFVYGALHFSATYRHRTFCCSSVDPEGSAQTGLSLSHSCSVYEALIHKNKMKLDVFTQNKLIQQTTK